MIWRSDISSKVALGLLLVAGLQGGELRGVLRTEGRRGGAGSDVSQVAVWLEPQGDSLPPDSSRRAQVIQQHKRFSPHILIVPVGTTVDFPNLDPIFHNAFSNFDGQIFDVSLYPPGSSRAVRFDRAGIVRIFCNIHPSMSAIIVVTPSDLYALSKPNGEFRIANVPEGVYGVHFFDERAKPETLASLTRSVAVSDGSGSLGVTTISEEGYLPVPHKNKYGHDYPAAAGEPAYSSVAK